MKTRTLPGPLGVGAELPIHRSFRLPKDPARGRFTSPACHHPGFLPLLTLALTFLAGTETGWPQSSSPSVPHWRDPFLQVARELHTRRVVALADFAHQNAFPFHTVTCVLSHWHTLASTNGGQLTLALEADARMTEVLSQYLKTGDLEPLLDFWLPNNSLDFLEFSANLRRFALQVEESNRHLPTDRQLSFRLLGLEPPSLLSVTNVTAADLPDLGQAGAVANARDRLCASNLLAYLHERPREKVLVFYGDLHLSLRPTSRSWAAKLFGSTDTWQPLAFLLQQQLRSNFWSVAQVQFPRSLRNPGHPHHALTTEDILVRAADIPWKHERIEPADYDAVVFFHATAIDEAHLFKYVCSRRVLERAIERLALFERFPQNPLTARHPALATTQEALQWLTGQSFSTSREWRAWAATNTYDGFARIDSSEFAEALRRLCGQPRKGPMLASLGLPMPLAFRNRQVTPEQWREVWPQVQPTVRFLQCLGIYWVGYPHEKAAAREYLVQFSGQDLASPADYLRWLRRNRMGLSY